MMNKQILKATILLLTLAILSPATVCAFGGGPGRQQGPSQEAIEACDGKSSGDRVEFTGRRGESLKATCQEVEGQLVAVPHNIVARSYPVVDTGQRACYNADGAEISCPTAGELFYGQDAQHTGNQPSYTDNGDGTVRDNVTGLMWQQYPADVGLNCQEAKDYCTSLNLGGYTDWRIPNTKQLFSISDFSQGWPYLDTTYFAIAGQSVSKDEQYWTEPYVGTTVEGGTNAAFGVNHGTGHIKAYPAAVSGPMGNYVRCVRGNNYYGANDFIDNGDGTITDKATGLMWQKADSGQPTDWPSALAYAKQATTAGYTDWRLPNVKELQSIVDYSRSPSAVNVAAQGPAINTDFFQLTQLPAGTTNTSSDYGYYWTSTSAYFGVDSPEYYYAWYVALGTAVNDAGDDFHGAGAVRFDTKVEGGPLGEGGERYYNYVLLVRDAKTVESKKWRRAVRPEVQSGLQSRRYD